jgi:mannose-6-phosphate isomerase-like protein (cupin superfamily)
MEHRVIELADTKDYQPLLQGPPQTCGMRSGRVSLDHGQYCSEHSTGKHEEVLVFLAGQGQALIGPDKTPHPVGQGKILYIPPDTLHNIGNTGTELLVYIYCVAPIK